jgi:hypothetical protein
MKYRTHLVSTVVAKLAAIALLAAPLASSAAPVAFQTDFTADTIHAESPVISQTATNWHIMASGNASNHSVGSGFFYLPMAPVGSAMAQAAARFSPLAHDLSEIGDFIEADVRFYPNNVRSIAFGFYNSLGSDPFTELANGGINGNLTTHVDEGTRYWSGFRMLIQTPTLAGTGFSHNLRSRPPQTGTNNRVQELLAATGGSADFNTPGPVNLSNLQTTGASFSFIDFGEYRLRLTITRSAADAFTVSYSLFDSSDIMIHAANAVSSATLTRPSDLTSAFDSFAFAFRNLANADSSIDITSLVITTQNSQIARVATQPTSQSLVPGQSSSLSVVADGVGPFTYQWFRNGSAIPNADGPTFNITNASSADVGTYHVTLSNALGSDRSSDVTVAVVSASAPSFTLQPAAQTVDAGTSLTLVAEVSGTPTPSIQWFRNATLTPGATSLTYVKENVTTDDAGTYYAVATNTEGEATSDSVQVTVVTAHPTITNHPVSVSVDVGQAIQLSVTATGIPAPTFEWFQNDEPIAGATLASYIVESSTTDDAGSYFVRVSNSLGSVDSVPASVTVIVIAPSISGQPLSQTITLGGNATFSVTSTGSAPLSYQWFRAADQPITGATSPVLFLSPVQLSDASSYYVVVTNDAGQATSDMATLTIVGTEATVLLNTNHATDTIHAATPVMSATSANWYLQSPRNISNSSVGDDPATEDVIEERPLHVTLNAITTSAIVEASTVFASTPVALSDNGDFIEVTATFRPVNINRAFAVGLFNSFGSLPHTGMLTGGLDNSGTAFSAGGTRNWRGYRASLDREAENPWSITTRPPQTATTNRAQGLVVPGTSSSFEDGVAIGSLAASTLPTFVDGEQYTLRYSITRIAPNLFSIDFRIFSGTEATGSSSFWVSSDTTAAGTLPSDMTDAFDSFAFGWRTTSNATLGSVTVENVKVVYGAATPISDGSEFASFVSSFGLDLATTGAPNADPDGDGIPNALEFVLGGSPIAADPSILPKSELAGSTWTFSFYQRDAAASEFAIAVESSLDLTTAWTPVVHGVDGATISSTLFDADGSLITVTVPATGPKLFLQLRTTPKP